MQANNFQIQSSGRTKFQRILTQILFLGMMGLILLPGSLQISASSPALQEAALLFRQANEHYHQGRYDQAVPIYRGLIEQGYRSGGLLYNLGNTYLKLGQKGQAVLYYEKARRLIPGDPAVNANLELALAEVKEGAPNWFGKAYRALLFLAPLNQLAVAVSASFFLFIFFICLAMLLPGLKNKTTGQVKGAWLGLIVVTGIWLVCLISVTTMTYIDQTKKQAVMVKPGAKVYFEPKLSDTSSFELDEGSRIYLLETNDGWTHIQRQDGKRGWIQGAGFEEI